ncbi:MAG TPA: hypothetical protein DIW17_12010 [Clostridiales bacterium]|nr:hypothetical protein [Clostridiales bacterium]
MPIIKFKQGIPHYFQIKDYFNRMIDTEKWEPGYKLPSEYELASSFGVSRMTVRRAISELTQKGKLEARQGIGTFVVEQRLSSIVTNLYAPKEQEGKHIVLKQSFVAASGEIAQFLKLREGEELYQIDRIRYFGKEPAAIERAFLQKSRFRDLEEEDLTGTIQDILTDRYKERLTFLKSFLEPIVADSETAKLLNIREGTPCMLFWRVTYSSSRVPAFCSKNIIRGDLCRLQINSQ